MSYSKFVLRPERLQNPEEVSFNELKSNLTSLSRKFWSDFVISTLDIMSFYFVNRNFQQTFCKLLTIPRLSSLDQIATKSI